MQVHLYSERTAAAVTALRRLGRTQDAQRLRDGLGRTSPSRPRCTAQVDYFATSLPTMLLFTEDIQAAHDTRVRVLEAQLALLDDVRTRRRSPTAPRDDPLTRMPSPSRPRPRSRLA